MAPFRCAGLSTGGKGARHVRVPCTHTTTGARDARARRPAGHRRPAELVAFLLVAWPHTQPQPSRRARAPLDGTPIRARAREHTPPHELAGAPTASASETISPTSTPAPSNKVAWTSADAHARTTPPLTPLQPLTRIAEQSTTTSQRPCFFFFFFFFFHSTRSCSRSRPVGPARRRPEPDRREAVAEALRYDCSLTSTPRVARQETVVGRRKVAPGAAVFCLLNAANRDAGALCGPMTDIAGADGAPGLRRRRSAWEQRGLAQLQMERRLLSELLLVPATWTWRRQGA